RHALLELLRRPLLVLDADVAIVLEDLLVVAGLALEQQRAAVHVLRQAGLVLDAEVVGPVLPVEEALVGHRDPVPRGVVRPDDGARRTRGAVARRRQLV